MATGYHDVWVLTYHTDQGDDVIGVYETLRQAMNQGSFYMEGDRTTHGTEFEPAWSHNLGTNAYSCSSVGDGEPASFVVRKSIFERIV